MLVIILALLALGGGGTVVALSLTEERRRVRLALRNAARRYGLVPEYLDAIAKVENGWRLAGTNMTGADAARGGAWGPTQITTKTARALGYTGDPAAFNRDPELAADWTGRILADAHRRQRLQTLADYVAAWNAGKDDADKNDNNDLEELAATHITRKDYLPRAKAALAAVQSLGPPAERAS